MATKLVQNKKAEAADPLASAGIWVKGARVHNLKNVDVFFPRKKLIVVTGVSGSGKSSLTIDTLFAEGQRRYAESLSAYARQFMQRMNKPDVDYIKGLCPAIAIEQKVISRTPRSTVGTMTEIYDYLRLLFARVGQTYSPLSGDLVKKMKYPMFWLPSKIIGWRSFVVVDPISPSSQPECNRGIIHSDAKGILSSVRRRSGGKN